MTSPSHAHARTSYRVRRLKYALGVSLILLAQPGLAVADNQPPQPQPTTLPVPQPTAPPVVLQPTPALPPVQVAPETGKPASSSPRSTSSAGSASSLAPVSENNGATASAPQRKASSASSQSTRALAPGPSGPSLSAASGQTTTDSNLSAILTSSTSAQAPAQLMCPKKREPTSAPFLQSPYHGWTEIASFLDHDNPDYAIDGKIVLANGMTAKSSEGQQSDLFPAYWSPALRQYVNYDGHNGYDLDISYQPVYAAAAGKVSFAGWNGDSEYVGYGQMILIDHGSGYTSLYGHLSHLEVKQGQHVHAGQEIGISGSTGHSSGPHLHFTVFHNCHVTDPYGWTGSGKDPLQSFSGERSTYLWLPGKDPLVLNPPPNWPTFPLGLRLNLSSGSPSARSPRDRRLPTVDRLLLLKLPTGSGQASSTALALARTEAFIAQEGGTVSSGLDTLHQQNLVQSSQVIPAAAAVWVRGSATAAQLEALPGVASLTGVTQRDLNAAQSGLAHAVLIQIAQRHAPSLWPSGFRSALHLWRPVASVANGHALVAGFVLPGQRILLSLRRGHTTVAAAGATGDSDSGGFVAMLHDGQGRPVAAHRGDRVEVVSAGRVAHVDVQGLSLQARARTVSGLAPPGVSLPIGLDRVTSKAGWQGVTTANSQGHFGVALPSHFPAGSLAVASIVNSAGDEEAATGFVPGLAVTAGAKTIRGWAGGVHTTLSLSRRGHLLARSVVKPAPDGTFHLVLWNGRQPVTVQAGDVLTLSSPGHRRSLLLPRLSVSLPLATTQLTAVAPRSSVVRLNVNRTYGSDWSRSISVAGASAAIRVPGMPLSVGDVASLEYTSPAGDSVLKASRVEGTVIELNTPDIQAVVKPGETVGADLLDSRGRPAATDTQKADPVMGLVGERLTDRTGRPADIGAGAKVEIRANHRSQVIALPKLRADLKGNELVVKGRPGSAVVVSMIDRRGRIHVETISVGAQGTTRLRFPARGAGSPDRVHVMMRLSQGSAFEQVLRSRALSGHPGRGGAGNTTRFGPHATSRP